MKPLLISEYRKFVSTRLWWILLLAMVGYMAFLAAVLTYSVTAGSSSSNMTALSPEQVAKTVYGMATAFGYVFPALIGVLSVTAEFRYQTITPTLLATPQRWRVLVAKLIGAAPVGFAFAVLGTLTVVGVGAAVLKISGEPTYLSEPAVIAMIARSILAMTIWILVGVGVGALIKNQVFAIVVVLAYTQLVEPAMRALLAVVGNGGNAIGSGTSGEGAISLANRISQFLPGSAGEAITGSSVYSSSGLGTLLPWWGGVIVLTGYALLFTAIGAVTTFRRDV